MLANIWVILTMGSSSPATAASLSPSPSAQGAVESTSVRVFPLGVRRRLRLMVVVQEDAGAPFKSPPWLHCNLREKGELLDVQPVEQCSGHVMERHPSSPLLS